MKKTLLRLFLQAAVLTGSIHAGEIYLAKDGSPRMTIVTPAKENARITEAARTLQQYVEKICGVKLPIRKDGRRVTGKAIYIGPCQGAPRYRLPRTGANWEGWTITEKNGNLYFNGPTPTPVAWGVYSFLEEDLGIRWFAPGELWELVPQAKTPGTLSVDVRSRTSVPQTSPRIWSGHHWSKDWVDWNMHNKVGSAEVVSKRNFQNMMPQIFPPKKYGKTHPEYYPPMPDGKRYIPTVGDPYWRPCESNPEVQKIVVSYIRNFFDRNPGVDSFSLGMDDITHMCCCPGCLAMDDAPDSYLKQRFSDRHYKFVNIIAGEIRKTHPDKYIGTCIYQIARELPRQITAMEPNVFGYITEICGHWYQPGMMQEDQNITREWRKRIKHLSRYDYIGYGSMTPRYYPHFLDRQMKFDKSLGLEGMYIETYTFLPLSMPMLWQLSKLQWNASPDTDKLLDEFMNIYGAAKPQMARFWDLLEKSYSTPRPGRGWEHRNIRKQAITVSPEDLDRAFAILAEAEKAAAGDKKVLARLDIHKSALRLSAYAVRPYAINRQLRDVKVDSRAAADQVFELFGKLEAAKAGRDEFIAALRKRDDLLGKNIRGLEARRGYIRLNAFSELEGDSIRALFQALSWYGGNCPAELEKRAAAAGREAKEYADSYMQNLRSGRQPENLLVNGDFEIRDEKIEKARSGCPKGWRVWTRGKRPVKLEIVPEGRSGNALKLSRCGAMVGSVIQSVAVDEDAVYLLTCYMKTSGRANGKLSVRFLTGKGAFCKDRKSETGIALQPEESQEWRPVTLCVRVPGGIGAGRMAVNLGFSGLKGDSCLMIDDVELYRLK